MSRIFHDLVCIDDRRPSPFCWRIKFALAHKGLAFEARPTSFTAIPRLYGGEHKTVPILADGERVIGDSWAIADYLDRTYPERPLFASARERAYCKFTEAWMFAAVTPTLFPMLVLDIHDHTLAEDRAYFRESREKRLKRTLEEVAAEREDKLEALRASFGPVRMTLTFQKQPFLSGEEPGFADYIVAGVLMWAASVSTLPLLVRDDPVLGWFERVRDAHGGIGRTSPTYALAE